MSHVAPPPGLHRLDPACLCHRAEFIIGPAVQARKPQYMPQPALRGCVLGNAVAGAVRMPRPAVRQPQQVGYPPCERLRAVGAGGLPLELSL